MSDFSMFLKENVKPVEDIEYVASKRFVDADGNPIKWILRPVPTKIENAIKDECIKFKARDRNFDVGKYQVKLCAAAVVFPNLKSVDLQDNYGVRGEEELLMELLPISGEFNALLAKVQEINDPETLDELVDEAKN
ncbi:MAG: hypothetical protein IKU98_00230 [Bacteroidaceae bacterium]|nr:hypothetical protein [Bacteroidaceae bacterium]